MEQRQFNNRYHHESELVSWVIEKGWLKNRDSAAFLFVIISILFISISIGFFTGGGVFGFDNKYQNRSDQPYYVTVPGVEERIKVNPGEDLNDVISNCCKNK